MMTKASETVSITEITDPALAGTLADIGAETFSQTFGHLYSPQDLQLFLTGNHSADCYGKLITDQETAVWLARNGVGDAIAYAVAGPCGLPVPDIPANSGELLRIYVRETSRGGGLGQKMLAQAFEWLEGRFDHIYLSVYAENHGAQRLYKRYGFEKVHDYFFMVGNHADPEFIMKRRNAGPGDRIQTMEASR